MIRLTDSPDMTIVVYHGRKTIKQQQPKIPRLYNAKKEQSDSMDM